MLIMVVAILVAMAVVVALYRQADESEQRAARIPVHVEERRPPRR